LDIYYFTNHLDDNNLHYSHRFQVFPGIQSEEHFSFNQIKLTLERTNRESHALESSHHQVEQELELASNGEIQPLF
jgi:hypothetical protein